MTQLVNTKKEMNQSPQAGMVTGKDNMKTYTFTAKGTQLTDSILSDLDIKFVRQRVEDGSQYLIDLEPMSPKVSLLRDHEECRIEMEEINYIPEIFKSILLTEKDASYKAPTSRGDSRGSYDRGSSSGGY